MAEYSIPYGKTRLTISLPEDRLVEVIAPPEIAAAPNPLAVVAQVLDESRFAPGESLMADTKHPRVAIAINDKTRPVPHQFLLPPLLEWLEAAGFGPESIHLIIATGTHPPMPPEEFGLVVPEAILKRYPVSCHDARDDSNLAWLGKTPHGTPVWINKDFINADLRIVVGNIEPHQFQGFSGGVKSAAIGLAGAATVNYNHALMTDPGSRLGEYETNPARQDVEEIGALIGIHFALNAILNHKKEIVQAVAGEPRLVMQQGIPLARRVCQVTVPAAYDLVIASPGGHPKDINVYQSQKGLYHACLVTRPGGTVILAAACPDGSGSRSYENWMTGMQSYEQVMERFEREGFRVGPHKAFQIARDASLVKLQLFSDMSADFAKMLLLNPISDLQAAIDAALLHLPHSARIGLMPRASSTIPFVAAS